MELIEAEKHIGKWVAIKASTIQYKRVPREYGILLQVSRNGCAIVQLSRRSRLGICLREVTIDELESPQK